MSDGDLALAILRKITADGIGPFTSIDLRDDNRAVFDTPFIQLTDEEVDLLHRIAGTTEPRRGGQTREHDG